MSTGPDEPVAAEPSPAPAEPAADTRARRLVATARQTLPEGTYAVGAGLVVAAITSYVFVIVALNSLQGEADKQTEIGFHLTNSDIGRCCKRM